jgi:hypothetical protein
MIALCSLSVLQLNQASQVTWFAIAMDYLPIQASAVPSECIFSSSAQTDTVHHNWIKPILMEFLQMLKFGMLFHVCFLFLLSYYCQV